MLFVSHHKVASTIAVWGEARAYYASWTRCGEFAQGSLMYCLVRSTAALHKLYTKADDAPQVPLPLRLGLEVVYCLSWPAQLLISRLPYSPAELLPQYFAYLRYLLAGCVVGSCILGALQPQAFRWGVVRSIMHL